MSHAGETRVSRAVKYKEDRLRHDCEGAGDNAGVSLIVLFSKKKQTSIQLFGTKAWQVHFIWAIALHFSIT